MKSSASSTTLTSGECSSTALGHRPTRTRERVRLLSLPYLSRYHELTSSRHFRNHARRPIVHLSYANETLSLIHPKFAFISLHFVFLTTSSVLDHSLKVHFKDSEGKLIRTVEANEGDDILAIAHEYDIDLEGASLNFLCQLASRMRTYAISPFFSPSAFGPSSRGYASFYVP